MPHLAPQLLLAALVPQAVQLYLALDSTACIARLPLAGGAQPDCQRWLLTNGVRGPVRGENGRSDSHKAQRIWALNRCRW